MRKRGSRFNEKWLLECGIEVNSRDMSSGAPTSAVCLFCQTFGKEEPQLTTTLTPALRKRKRSQNIKLFKPPWRADKMKEHHSKMHPSKWRHYQTCSQSEQQQYFTVRNMHYTEQHTIHTHSFPSIDHLSTKPPHENIHNHDATLGEALPVLHVPAHLLGNGAVAATCSSQQQTIFVDKMIVQVLLNQLLSCSDSAAVSNGSRNGMEKDAYFHLVDDGVLIDEDDVTEREVYKAIIWNGNEYEQVIRMVSAGLSFRQVVNLMQMGTRNAHQLTNRDVAQLVRVFCGRALQIIRRSLLNVWSFSMELTCRGTAGGSRVVDVRVHFVLGSTLFNIHVLAMSVSQNGEGMFDMIKQTFDALCPEWEKKLIGYMCGDDLRGTVRHQDVGARIEEIVHDGFYCVWCAANELDLVVQSVLSSVCNEQFISVIQAISGHLRRQKQLIAKMRSTCPKCTDSTWLSIGTLINWLTNNRPELQQHFAEVKTSCEPEKYWWVLVFSLQKMMNLCKKYIIQLQGKQLLMHQQKQILETLRERLMSIGNVQSTSAMLPSNAGYDVVNMGGFSMSMQSSKVFVQNLGNMHVVSLYQELEAINPERFHGFNKCIANMFVKLVHRIFLLSPQRGSTNRVNTELPPCQPHSIACINAFTFSNIVRKQLGRIKHSYDELYVDQLEVEFQGFKEKYDSDSGFKALVDQTNSIAKSFRDNWNWLEISYPKLVEFCGGLASVIPGKKSNEANSCTYDWERNECRGSSTDLALECILQAKQQCRLQELESVVDRFEEKHLI